MNLSLTYLMFTNLEDGFLSIDTVEIAAASILFCEYVIALSYKSLKQTYGSSSIIFSKFINQLSLEANHLNC